MRAGFVSFKSRWGAAVCAQTQQSRDHTQWLTEWAPEPRDVYWRNLSLPYMMLSFRRLSTFVVVTVLLFLFFIPVAFVQSLVNLDSLNKYLPFLKPLMQKWVRLSSDTSDFEKEANMRACSQHQANYLATISFWDFIKYGGMLVSSYISRILHCPPITVKRVFLLRHWSGKSENISGQGLEIQAPYNIIGGEWAVLVINGGTSMLPYHIKPQ